MNYILFDGPNRDNLLPFTYTRHKRSVEGWKPQKKPHQFDEAFLNIYLRNALTRFAA